MRPVRFLPGLLKISNYLSQENHFKKLVSSTGRSPIIHIYSLLSKVVNSLLILHLGKVETSTIPGNKSQVINTISEI